MSNQEKTTLFIPLIALKIILIREDITIIYLDVAPQVCDGLVADISIHEENLSSNFTIIHKTNEART